MIISVPGEITSKEKSCSHVYLQAVLWPSSSAPALCCWPRRPLKPRCRRRPARRIRLLTFRKPGARPVFASARWALASPAVRVRVAAIIAAAGSIVGAIGSAIDRVELQSPASIISAILDRGQTKTAAGTISDGRNFLPIRFPRERFALFKHEPNSTPTSCKACGYEKNIRRGALAERRQVRAVPGRSAAKPLHILSIHWPRNSEPRYRRTP
jgi:hypothetical protein